MGLTLSAFPSRHAAAVPPCRRRRAVALAAVYYNNTRLHVYTRTHAPNFFLFIIYINVCRGLCCILCRYLCRSLCR